MEYSKLLDFATDLGYSLAKSGAETFRVEESISRVLAAYDIQAEVFVIPNCMHISIEPVVGRPLTRMRRIDHPENDLDAVERYSGLSRRICAETPPPEIAARWLEETCRSCKRYSLPIHLLGNALGAFGFAMLFGGNLNDAFYAGLCGILVGLVIRFMNNLRANLFFTTIAASFPMAVIGYLMAHIGLAHHADAVIIGPLMILVPGLLFTNAMRDIIFGDTNSGINRIVQVLLIAVAIALGTATAWSTASFLWGAPAASVAVTHPFLIQCLVCSIGCLGFTILFNIHGPGGLLCVLGGLLTWLVYQVCIHLGVGDIASYFWAAVFASLYSEVMARIRKCPACPYLVVAIFPLIPGSGVYYTMCHAMEGEMELFASRGMFTAGIAGVMAVGILMISTCFRLWTNHKSKK